MCSGYCVRSARSGGSARRSSDAAEADRAADGIEVRLRSRPCRSIHRSCLRRPATPSPVRARPRGRGRRRRTAAPGRRAAARLEVISGVTRAGRRRRSRGRRARTAGRPSTGRAGRARPARRRCRVHGRGAGQPSISLCSCVWPRSVRGASMRVHPAERARGRHAHRRRIAGCGPGAGVADIPLLRRDGAGVVRSRRRSGDSDGRSRVPGHMNPSRRVRGPTWGRRYEVSIIAWIVLGAIAGYLAGFLVKGDEGLGVIGHIVLGIVGALVGGFLASVLFNSKPIDGPFDISSIVVADHRCDHHGRRGRDGHRQRPDGPRVHLTRGRCRAPGPAASPRRTPTAGRWAFVLPPVRVAATLALPRRCNARGRSGGRSRHPRATMLGQVGSRATGGPGADVPAGPDRHAFARRRAGMGSRMHRRPTVHSPPRQRIDQPGAPVTGRHPGSNGRPGPPPRVVRRRFWTVHRRQREGAAR